MEFIQQNGTFEAYLIIIIKNITVKSFYYLIYKNFPWFLLADFGLIVICLYLCSRWLAIDGYYYYHCSSDNQQ